MKKIIGPLFLFIVAAVVVIVYSTADINPNPNAIGEYRKSKFLYFTWIPLPSIIRPGGGGGLPGNQCPVLVELLAPCRCGGAQCTARQVCIDPMGAMTCTVPNICMDMMTATMPCKCGTAICNTNQFCNAASSNCSTLATCSDGTLLTTPLCRCGMVNCVRDSVCTLATSLCNVPAMCAAAGVVTMPCRCGTDQLVCPAMWTCSAVADGTCMAPAGG